MVFDKSMNASVNSDLKTLENKRHDNINLNHSTFFLDFNAIRLKIQEPAQIWINFIRDREIRNDNLF